jgi:hypothetical protein
LTALWRLTHPIAVFEAILGLHERPMNHLLWSTREQNRGMQSEFNLARKEVDNATAIQMQD